MIRKRYLREQKRSLGPIFLIAIIFVILGFIIWASIIGISSLRSNFLAKRNWDTTLEELWEKKDMVTLLNVTSNRLEKNPTESKSILYNALANYYIAETISSYQLKREEIEKTIFKLRYYLVLEDKQNVNECYYTLGKCYYIMGDGYWDLCYKYLIDVLQNGYYSSDIYQYLAESSFNLGLYEDSLTYLHRLENQEPSSQLYERIADIHHALNNLNNAEQYYKMSIEFSYNENLSQKVLFKLANLYYDIDEWEKVISYIKEYIENDPNDAEAFFILGESYFFLGNIQEARVYWHKTVALKSNHRPALLRLYG